MKTTPVIRPLQPSDDPTRLTELVHEAYAPHVAHGLRFWGTHQSVADTIDRLASGQGLVAVSAGEYVGTLTVRPPQAESPVALYRDPFTWSIAQFAAAPASKGSGLGRALHDAAVAYARQNGARRMALDTAAPAESLIAMYRAWGYRPVGEHDWRPQTNYRSVLMQLDLSEPADAPDPQAITTVAQLRALIGEPAETTRAKLSDRLNAATRVFIERSPFVCVATRDAEGRCDVSPRGDPPGFVRILDDRTLLVPERPGNRLADSLVNLLANPRIGLLFVVPGVTDTFRVNGRGRLTADPASLAASAVEGKAPLLGVVVEIEEAYTQCSKAFLRSQLWDPARFVDTAAMPTGGEVLREIRGEAFDAQAHDAERAERYRQRVGFY